MGNDQGNVPLNLLVEQHRMLCSRAGSLLFAFCFLCLAAIAQPPTTARCGFAERVTPNLISKIHEGVQAVLRPTLPEFVESGDGRFRIHYAASGPDAVPNVDSDGNALPYGMAALHGKRCVCFQPGFQPLCLRSGM